MEEDVSVFYWTAWVSSADCILAHRVALRIKWERVCKGALVTRWIISKQGFLIGGHPSTVTKFGLYSFLIGDMKDSNITRACRLSDYGPHIDHRCLLFVWYGFYLLYTFPFFIFIFIYFLCFGCLLVTAGILLWVCLSTSGFFCCCWSMQTLSCSVWDLVPWPRMEPGPPVLGAWILSRWTTREVPDVNFKRVLIWWCACPPSALYQSVLPIFFINLSMSI